jgi:hypothetical protein
MRQLRRFRDAIKFLIGVSPVASRANILQDLERPGPVVTAEGRIVRGHPVIQTALCLDAFVQHRGVRQAAFAASRINGIPRFQLLHVPVFRVRPVDPHELVAGFHAPFKVPMPSVEHRVVLEVVILEQHALGGLAASCYRQHVCASKSLDALLVP